MTNKIKVAGLFLGDIAVLYLALIFTLYFRYGYRFYSKFTEHFLPFTIIFIFWVVIFYIAGLYDLRRLQNNINFIKIIGLAIFVNAALAAAFFYFLPVFGVAPKTNLFIFIFVFFVMEILWRRFWNRRMSRGETLYSVVLINGGKVGEEIYQTLKNNPQLGYKIKLRLGHDDVEPDEIQKLVEENSVIFRTEGVGGGVNLIVVPRDLKNDRNLAGVLYKLLQKGVEIRDLPTFYEEILRKIPLDELEEAWFLENFTTRRFYDSFKRAVEIMAALILGMVLLPLLILIAIFVRMASAGPIIYKQVRIGKGGREFVLYKFRTMRVDAEKDGARWAKPDDGRVTAFGKLLRFTHLDELPQLINIVNGSLSFVGPRPERPEFVDLIKREVPYYDVRHLVKPGVSGWAQINYRYGSSIEDAREKLEYDIYYIKNRSPILDLAIVLKTLKSFFVNPK